MHKCLSYSELGSRSFEEEHQWALSMYLELRLAKEKKEVVVCRHPSYVAVEDVAKVAEEVYRIAGDEIDVIVGISRLLDRVYPDWRRDFEVVVRRNFVSVSVYL